MPRPPILPVMDWETLFGSGKGYREWLEACEDRECRAAIETIRQEVALAPHEEASLAALKRRVDVLALADARCGDVVRHVPVLERLADAAPNLVTRYIAREQSPEAFARFLTNGGEAIPKFVFFSEDFVECGNWGPMPEACREWIARGKACGDVPTARQRVSALYDADPGKRVVVRELMGLIDIAVTSLI